MRIPLVLCFVLCLIVAASAEFSVGPTTLSKTASEMIYDTSFLALASPFKPNQGGTLTSLGIYLDDSKVASRSSYALSIWSNNATSGQPGTRLASTTTENTITGTTCGFVSLISKIKNVKWDSVQNNVNIVANTQYWLVITATIGSGSLGIGLVDGSTDVTNRWAKVPNVNGWVKMTTPLPVFNFFIYLAGNPPSSPSPAPSATLPPTTTELGWNPTSLTGMFGILTSSTTGGGTPFAVPFTLNPVAGSNVVYAMKSFGIWLFNSTGSPANYSGVFRFGLYAAQNGKPVGTALAAASTKTLVNGRNDIALPTTLFFNPPPTGGSNYLIYFITSVDALPIRSVPSQTSLQAEFVRTCTLPNFNVETLSWSSSTDGMVLWTTWANGNPNSTAAPTTPPPTATTTKPAATTTKPVATTTKPAATTTLPAATTTKPAATTTVPASTTTNPAATTTKPAATTTQGGSTAPATTSSGSTAPATSAPAAQVEEAQGETMRASGGMYLIYNTNLRALAYPWTATKTGTLTSFGIYILSNTSVAGSFSLSLFSYVNGATAPGGLLATTATVGTLTRTLCNFLYLWDDAFEVKLPVTGSPITITAGTTYWIVFNGNASVPVYISLTDKPVVSDLWAKIPTTTSWVSLTTPMAPINLFVYTNVPAPAPAQLGSSDSIVGMQTDAAEVIYTTNGGVTGATLAWLAPFRVSQQTEPNAVNTFTSFGIVVENLGTPKTYTGPFQFALFASDVSSNMPVGRALAFQSAASLVTGQNNITLASPVALSVSGGIYWIWFGTSTKEVPLRVGIDAIATPLTFTLRSEAVRACAVPDLSRESPQLDQFTSMVNLYGVLSSGVAGAIVIPTGSSTAFPTGTSITTAPPTDTNGNPITVVPTTTSFPTDTNGNPITTAMPTDTNGNPITTVAPTDTNGNPITAVPTDPNGSPVPTYPSGSPVPTSPSGSPVPTYPSGSPVPTSPSGSPVPTYPSGSPLPTYPSGSPVPTSPSGSPVPTYPSGAPIETLPTGSPVPTQPSGTPTTTKPQRQNPAKWKLVVTLRLLQCSTDLEVVKNRLLSLLDSTGQFYLLDARCSSKRAAGNGTLEIGSDTAAGEQQAHLNAANTTAAQQPETSSSKVVEIKKGGLAWWIIVIIVILLILLIIIVIVIIVMCLCCAASIAALTAFLCAKLCCCCNTKEENEDYELMLGREHPRSDSKAAAPDA